MIRGDTQNYKWIIEVKNIDGSKTFWTPEENDRVYFTCKKDYGSDIAFQKTYPENIEFNKDTGYFTTTIEQKDTYKLSIGTYIYDIKIIKNAINETEENKRFVKTVAQGRIEIEPEVTSRKDEI